MFIKRGDGVITGIVTTDSELTEEQKKRAEKLAKNLSAEKSENTTDKEEAN